MPEHSESVESREDSVTINERAAAVRITAEGCLGARKATLTFHDSETLSEAYRSD
jgi:hypothetical protein